LAKQYDITIEYGLESISDETLKKINRGHNVQSYLDALQMTQNKGIKICTHMIFGFPWEDEALWIDTAEWLNQQKFDFLKVHQLHVVRDTALAKMHERQPFKLLGYPEYFEIITKFLEKLSPEIIIQRLFGEAPLHTIIAPNWGIRNYELLVLFDEKLEKVDSWQGKKFNSLSTPANNSNSTEND